MTMGSVIIEESGKRLMEVLVIGGSERDMDGEKCCVRLESRNRRGKGLGFSQIFEQYQALNGKGSLVE